ncbi:MAG: polyphosphate polymerase domain-containing protein [Clostridiaceae bacterium]|nr:polyphosphate polymerase domain-containing protein [Clostridiaceae bacterium]
MAQEIFKRYEKKYLLTEEQYLGLKRVLEDRMEADAYGVHTISNIYFDTKDFELIRTSLDGPVYKEKLRLRAYGQVNEKSMVFLEMKKKYSGVVYKRRVPMELASAVRYLNDGILPELENQIFREIQYMKQRYHLKPAAYVAYDRVACSCKADQELRVTFDRNIRCRTEGLDLQAGTYGTSLLEEGRVLMEVKIPGAMPVWMSRGFSELGIYPVSFSKYGRYYREYLVNAERLERCGRDREGGRDCA